MRSLMCVLSSSFVLTVRRVTKVSHSGYHAAIHIGPYPDPGEPFRAPSSLKTELDSAYSLSFIQSLLVLTVR